MFTLTYDGHRMHPLWLGFSEPALEAAYQSEHLPYRRDESRLGLYIVILSWAVYAWYAPSLVPPDVAPQIQRLALATLTVFVVAQGLCHLAALQRFHQAIMLGCSLVAFADVVFKSYLTPTLGSSFFFPAVLLLSLWSFALAGNRFVYSLVFPVVFSGAYLAIYVANHGAWTFEFHNGVFYLFCAFGMGIAVSWYKEYQSRVIFLIRRELDEERREHLHRSLHDPLTGLPNRVLLKDRIQQEIAKAARRQQVNAGIFVDLDGFKTLNDEHGHQAGDALLKEVADRFSGAVRHSDTVARLSGDEFFVLAVDVGGREMAMALAHKLLASLAVPMPNAAADGPGVSASLGVCLFPFDQCDADSVVTRADAAMYAVKRTRKGAIGFAGP